MESRQIVERKEEISREKMAVIARCLQKKVPVGIAS
jgi:hypothetical protein